MAERRSSGNPAGDFFDSLGSYIRSLADLWDDPETRPALEQHPLIRAVADDIRAHEEGGYGIFGLGGVPDVAAGRQQLIASAPSPTRPTQPQRLGPQDTGETTIRTPRRGPTIETSPLVPAPQPRTGGGFIDQAIQSAAPGVAATTAEGVNLIRGPVRTISSSPLSAIQRAKDALYEQGRAEGWSDVELRGRLSAVEQVQQSFFNQLPGYTTGPEVDIQIQELVGRQRAARAELGGLESAAQTADITNQRAAFAATQDPIIAEQAASAAALDEQIGQSTLLSQGIDQQRGALGLQSDELALRGKTRELAESQFSNVDVKYYRQAQTPDDYKSIARTVIGAYQSTGQANYTPDDIVTTIVGLVGRQPGRDVVEGLGRYVGMRMGQASGSPLPPPAAPARGAGPPPGGMPQINMPSVQAYLASRGMG